MKKNLKAKKKKQNKKWIKWNTQKTLYYNGVVYRIKTGAAAKKKTQNQPPYPAVLSKKYHSTVTHTQMQTYIGNYRRKLNKKEKFDVNKNKKTTFFCIILLNRNTQIAALLILSPGWLGFVIFKCSTRANIIQKRGRRR